jgi:DNA-nicking Smr family endonuclease
MAPRKATVKPTPLIPDQEVWQQVVQSARPLKKPANVVPQPLAPLPKVYKPEGVGAAAYAKAEAKQKAPLPAHASSLGRPTEKPALQMDKRLRQRFERGELPVEARIDLHGMTLANAERALSKFLRDGIAQQKRCLLVITGKGSIRSDNEIEIMQKGRGVLRAWLPDYLKRGPWRDQILGLAPARPDMGGTGAFYVLLRRQRDEAPVKTRR